MSTLQAIEPASGHARRQLAARGQISGSEGGRGASSLLSPYRKRGGSNGAQAISFKTMAIFSSVATGRQYPIFGRLHLPKGAASQKSGKKVKAVENANGGERGEQTCTQLWTILVASRGSGLVEGGQALIENSEAVASKSVGPAIPQRPSTSERSASLVKQPSPREKCFHVREG